MQGSEIFTDYVHCTSMLSWLLQRIMRIVFTIKLSVHSIVFVFKIIKKHMFNLTTKNKKGFLILVFLLL